MPDRIIKNYLLPTPVPNKEPVDHAQALADVGKYNESWRYLAELEEQKRLEEQRAQDRKGRINGNH